MTEKEETTENLEKRRQDLVFSAGQKQFTKAVAEAELLQINQEIVNINNVLGKRQADALGKTKGVPVANFEAGKTAHHFSDGDLLEAEPETTV